MPSPNKPECIYFVDGPSIEDLCSVTVKVPPLQNCAGSPYQPHVIRCRELVFTEPDIVASPLLDIDRHIQIIMQQSYYKTGRLQARFQKIGIEMQKPRRVLPHELQSCINYTILARLAPMWNKLGELLVEGRDFVSSVARMKALRFELTVGDGQVYMSLRGSSVRSVPVKLRDLDVSPPLVHEFNNSYPHGHIKEYSIGRKWCHILPSMKKGQVINVCQTLPHDSPFKSYKDMKRYWKNTYGYRLPESEEGVLFCQVYFKLIGEKLFTYPHYCIRPYELAHLPSGDDESIVHGFLMDLQAKVPALCGVKLQVFPQAQYTRAQLGDIVELSSKPNLSCEKPIIMTQRAPPPVSNQLRESHATVAKGHIITVPENMRINQQVLYQNKIPELRPAQVVPGQTAAIPCSNGMAGSQQIRLYNHQSQATSSSQSQADSNQARVISSQSQASSTQARVISSQSQTSSTQARVISSQSQASSTQARKIIPVFKAIKPKLSIQIPKPAVTKPRTVPVFHPGVRKPAAVTSQGSHPARRSSAKISDKRQDLSKPQQREPETGVSLCTPVRPSSQKHAIDSGYSSSRWSMTPSKSLPYLPYPSPHQVPRMPVLGHDQTGVSVPGTPEQWGVPSLPISAQKHRPNTGTPGKRPTLQEGDTPKAKKARSKPKVQDHVNIEGLARDNMLGKVNSVTLTSWLRDQGVSCKVKDKKTDLILKVQNLLGITV